MKTFAFPFDRLKRLVRLKDGWTRVVGLPPDIYPEMESCFVIVPFKGYLFFVGSYTNGLQIWKSGDGAKWVPCVGEQAGVPGGFGNSAIDDAFCSVVVGDEWYLGTSSGIWFTKDTVKWQQVKVEGLDKAWIMAIEYFKGYVYAAEATNIWRGNGEKDWTMVAGDKDALETKAGFGDKDVTDITSLKVFDDKLYAGAGYDNMSAMYSALWCTTDGIHWNQFKKMSKSLHIYALHSFEGYLFAGGYHTLQVFRTDGTGTSWEDVTGGIGAEAGNPAARCMEIHNGKLYLGIIGDAGNKILWYSENGKTWTYFDTKSLGPDKNRINAICSYQDHMYISTFREYKAYFPESKNVATLHKLEIWRYGPRWAPETWLNFDKPVLANNPLIRLFNVIVQSIRYVSKGVIHLVKSITMRSR